MENLKESGEGIYGKRFISFLGWGVREIMEKNKKKKEQGFLNKLKKRD